jgi:hypothetical protein
MVERSWGRSMLREFAAKQQMLSVRHVFTDVVTRADEAAMADLLVAIDVLLGGSVEGGVLRRVLVTEDIDADAIAAFAEATPTLTSAQAGMLLGLAYLPVEAVDAAAMILGGGARLTGTARAIDPRGSLTPRTRLFLADRMIREPGLPSLLGAVSALASLRANGGHPEWGEWVEPDMRPRLLRLREAVYALRSPALLAAALSSCLRGDWVGAERRLQEAAPAEAAPPRLADLFAVSLLPSCDTIDAVERLRNGGGPSRDLLR